VVGEAGDGAEALRILARTPADMSAGSWPNWACVTGYRRWCSPTSPGWSAPAS